jgi:hypothetical protein
VHKKNFVFSTIYRAVPQIFNARFENQCWMIGVAVKLYVIIQTPRETFQMNFAKSLLVVVFFTVALAARAGENMTPDAQNIDTACATDAATAGCTNEKVGTGLLKCLHAYKKTNHSYTFSAPCKTAMEKMHADRKAANSH